MAKRGPDFYDDASVFAAYRAKSAQPYNAKETLEKPVFDELVGALRELRILDLGCGDTQFGREALQEGCRTYVGIEGSRNMFHLAQTTLAATKGTVIHAPIEAWSYPEQQFDLVTARLVLHYVEDLATVVAHVYRSLVPGGRFIFSVEHPVITSCDRAWRGGGVRQDWIVDDYFATGRRVVSWMGGELIKFHRTVEDYFSTLRTSGFAVDAVRESSPKRAVFADDATYERRKRIPLMLFFAARRPPANRVSE